MCGFDVLPDSKALQAMQHAAVKKHGTDEHRKKQK